MHPITPSVFDPISTPECLTAILRDEVNLAIWKRSLPDACAGFARAFAREAGAFERFLGIRPGERIDPILPGWAVELSGAQAWLADVSHTIDMFQCLFEPAAIGIRVHVLSDTMCPRFHTDRVPVRLLVTYAGPGTEWLPERYVIRGDTNKPLPDQPAHGEAIRSIATGAVSLLKGEAWIGNEGRGLVHRSPAPGPEPRLVLGLDWLS